MRFELICLLSGTFWVFWVYHSPTQVIVVFETVLYFFHPHNAREVDFSVGKIKCSRYYKPSSTKTPTGLYHRIIHSGFTSMLFLQTDTWWHSKASKHRNYIIGYPLPIGNLFVNPCCTGIILRKVQDSNLRNPYRFGSFQDFWNKPTLPTFQKMQFPSSTEPISMPKSTLSSVL